ncbi:MAG TPA: ABC transporter permease subunit [Candidatus Limnocylindrales bacterium]|nr:ABC transporter permease subunit [Candidatus Limnocylindrales bacterium]
MTAVVRSVLGAMRATRRGAIAWWLATGLLIVATVAFWPAFRGASGLSDAFSQLPSGLIQALGLEDFATPAGFLRGNLYELLVPLLLVGAAVGFANGLTAGEEDAGRLELLLAQPASRQRVFLARAVAVAAWLGLIVLGLIALQLLADRWFDLQLEAGRIAATVAVVGLLAALHGALAIAIAGLRPRPSLVLGLTVAIAIGGFAVSALFPLSASLRPWADLSPWRWALAGDPLVNGVEPWRWLALAAPSLLLVLVGTVAFTRRDVRSA